VRELRRPIGIRGQVYADLAYNTGTTVPEIMMATGLTRTQVRSALQGMQELGYIESLPPRGRFSDGQPLWFRVGASEGNDPFTRPSDN
jgi:hypothetical protein